MLIRSPCLSPPALEFGNRGWKVAVTDIDAAKLKEITDAVRAAGSERIEMVLDVTHRDQFKAAAKNVSEE